MMKETMNEEIALTQIKGLLTILGYVDQAEEQLKILALGITELDLLRKLQKEHAKKLKALEIIIKKNITPYEDVVQHEDYNDYLMYRSCCQEDLEENEVLASKLLTKEEFYLLKEELL